VSEPSNAPDTSTCSWGGLYIVFASLLALTLASYFGRATSPKDEYLELQSALRQKMLISTLGEKRNGPLAVSPLGSTMKSVVLPEGNLGRKIAKVLLALEREEGRGPRLDCLSILALSPSAEDKAFAAIYKADSLSLSQARALIAAVPKEPIENKSARIHALEKAGDKTARLREVSPLRVGIFVGATVLIASGVILGLILWAVYLGLRAQGGLRPLGHPAGELSHRDAGRFASRATQLMLAFVGLSLLAALLLRVTHLTPVVQQVLFMSVLVLLLPLIARIRVGGERVSLRMQGWRSDHLAKNILWGVAGAAANAPLVLLLAIIGKLLFSGLPSEAHPATLEIAGTTDLLTVMLIAAMASVLAPIFEETVFRGTLLPAMASQYRSFPKAIIVSSLFFAMMHPTGPPSWLPLAGIGATSCLLTYQTRSLVPSVVMHAVHNFVTLAIVIAVT
jgi:membrane protease YdiL (CAAX protease family)